MTVNIQIVYAASTCCGGGSVHDVPGLVAMYEEAVDRFNRTRNRRQRSKLKRHIEDLETELYRIGNKK